MPLKTESSFLRWALVPDRAADLIRAGELRDPRRNEERTSGASLHRTNKTKVFFSKYLERQVSYPEWVNSAQEPEEERKWRREANLHLITKSFSLTNIDPMSETCQQLAKRDGPFAAFENIYSSKLMLSVSLSNRIVHILNESTWNVQLCSCAVVQLCSCVIVQLYSYTIVQMCRFVIVHLCSCAELVMERMPRDNVHLWCCCFTFLAFLSSLKLFSKVVPFLLCFYVLFTFGITVHCTRKVHILLQTENAQTMCISPTQCSTFSAFSSPCS